MKAIATLFTIAALTLAANAADAKGCIKGAVVGGVAGHYAGHHGVVGAIAGCAYGHHRANRGQPGGHGDRSSTPRGTTAGTLIGCAQFNCSARAVGRLIASQFGSE